MLFEAFAHEEDTVRATITKIVSSGGRHAHGRLLNDYDTVSIVVETSGGKVPSSILVPTGRYGQGDTITVQRSGDGFALVDGEGRAA